MSATERDAVRVANGEGVARGEVTLTIKLPLITFHSSVLLADCQIIIKSSSFSFLRLAFFSS